MHASNLFVDSCTKLLYRRIAFVCEEGFSISPYIKARVFLDNGSHDITDLKFGTPIRVLGVYGRKTFHITSIDRCEFDECDRCLYPTSLNITSRDDGSCIGCGNEENDKVEGIWKLISVETKTFLGVKTTVALFENDAEDKIHELFEKPFVGLAANYFTDGIGKNFELRGWYRNLAPDDANADSDDQEYENMQGPFVVSRAAFGKSASILKMVPTTPIELVDR